MKSKAKYEGIIIIGVPRSGTTLLRRLLDAHPNIACPGETNLLSASARFLHSDSIAEDVEIGVLTGLTYAGFTEDEVMLRLRNFVAEFHREHAKRQNKERWAEKTAFDAFYLEAIERLWGEHAYFICIQRNGLDVACSLKELCDKNGGFLSELHNYIKQFPRQLEAFAHVWVDLTKAIRAFAKNHIDNTLMIRYEDLVEDPEKTLRTIIKFVEEDWDPRILQIAMQKRKGVGLGDWKTYEKTEVDKESIGRYKSLSRATITLLGNTCNKTLQACGYDAVDVTYSHSKHESRRRYEIGLLVNAMRKRDSKS